METSLGNILTGSGIVQRQTNEKQYQDSLRIGKV